MIYNNGEVLTAHMPKPMDDVPDLSYGSQPVFMGHLQAERNKIEQELSQLKDPTYRADFEAPALPYGYQEHKTDDAAVKAAGKELAKRLEYVERNAAEWQIQTVAFQEAVSRRGLDEAEYQTRLTQAVENGEDVPDSVEHEDLAPLHKELNKLENAITVGARVAHESRDKLDAAYENLYASETYRRYADREIQALTDNAAKAVALLRDALASREVLVDRLPDAFADLDGVPFAEPVSRRNSLGVGGMDPYGGDGAVVFSLGDALAKLESVTIPGDGIRPWKLDQLDDEEKQDYAERAARAKVERQDTRTPVEKRQDIENQRYADYLDSGGKL
ncbi:hypothetical protein ACFWVU_18460 [Streptomyces sp. NPDC058686]|uniref:hypothetical protein n=1 Tax=Streptomyces sp. NPDC058686 TaxID=3346599 RepID=UPI00364968B9